MLGSLQHGRPHQLILIAAVRGAVTCLRELQLRFGEGRVGHGLRWNDTEIFYGRRRLPSSPFRSLAAAPPLPEGRGIREPFPPQIPKPRPIGS